MYHQTILKYLLLTFPEILVVTHIILKINDKKVSAFNLRIILVILLLTSTSFLSMGQAAVSEICLIASLLLSILHSFSYFNISTDKVAFSTIFGSFLIMITHIIHEIGIQLLFKVNVFTISSIEYIKVFVPVIPLYLIIFYLNKNWFINSYNYLYKIYKDKIQKFIEGN